MGMTLKGRKMATAKRKEVWVSSIDGCGHGDEKISNVIWRDMELLMSKRGSWKDSPISFIFDNKETLYEMLGQLIEEDVPDVSKRAEHCKYCDGSSRPYKVPGKKEYFIKCGSCGLCSPAFPTPDEAVEYWNINKCQRSKP
jgi:hypothetical protein